MASLTTAITNLTTRIATESKAHKTFINGNVADLSALATTNKTNLVAALNELKTMIDTATAAAGATINDAATSSTTQTWSINKISAQVTAAINAVTNGAPTALDTLDELAGALGDDANFAATLTTALGNRVRFDAAQTLTSGQKTQALANIGAVASADVGDVNTDFVATFNAGLI